MPNSDDARTETVTELQAAQRDSVPGRLVVQVNLDDLFAGPLLEHNAAEEGVDRWRQGGVVEKLPGSIVRVDDVVGTHAGHLDAQISVIGGSDIDVGVAAAGGQHGEQCFRVVF